MTSSAAVSTKNRAPKVIKTPTEDFEEIEPLEEPLVLPAGTAELLSLFEGKLGSVNFPDVSTELFNEAVEQIGAASKEVAQARAELSRAESRRADAEAVLVRLAEKGLAYAKVYAADDSELSELLSKLKFGSNPQPSRRLRKPRPVKNTKKSKRAENAESTENPESAETPAEPDQS